MCIRDRSREAFYHILSALLTGILEDGRSAMAVWDDAEGRVHRMEAHDEEDMETVLLELYQTLQGIPKSGENDLNGKDRNPEDRSEWNEKEERMRGEGFGLNRNLELFYNAVSYTHLSNTSSRLRHIILNDGGDHGFFKGLPLP